MNAYFTEEETTKACKSDSMLTYLVLKKCN